MKCIRMAKEFTSKTSLFQKLEENGHVMYEKRNNTQETDILMDSTESLLWQSLRNCGSLE